MVQNEEEIVEVSLEVHGPDAAKENGNRPTTATLSAWSGGGKVHPNPAQRSRRESSLFGLERNYSIELTEQNGSKTVLVVANNTNWLTQIKDEESGEDIEFLFGLVTTKVRHVLIGPYWQASQQVEIIFICLIFPVILWNNEGSPLSSFEGLWLSVWGLGRWCRKC